MQHNVCTSDAKSQLSQNFQSEVPIKKEIEKSETNGSNNKKYDQIPYNIRMAFIKRVLSQQATIREASLEFGIKFSTSKAILQTFRKEGRVGKKKFRLRKTKDGHTMSEFPTPKDIEMFQKIEQQLNEDIDIIEDSSIQQSKLVQTKIQQKVEPIIQEKSKPQEIYSQPIPQFTIVQQLPQPPPIQQYTVVPCQFVQINSNQFFQMQMMLQRTQMELEQQKQLNHQLVEFINSFQCKRSETQLIKQEVIEKPQGIPCPQLMMQHRQKHSIQ